MIYIIRHGQTENNRKGVLQGRSNAPMNDEGRKQAEKASDFFERNGIRIDRIYSSPLIRAVETAEIVSGGDHAVITDDRLLEMDYGPYEGVSLEEPPQEIITFFSDFVHNPAPEGMEQLSHVTARMGDFLNEIADNGEAENYNVLISTHAIAMKGALEYLTPDSNGSYWSKYIPNCGLYSASFSAGSYSVPKECSV